MLSSCLSKKTNNRNYIINTCFLYARLEAAKDDYRVHCEELEKQLIEFQHRNDELTSLAEETRALKDEIDVLRYGMSKYNYVTSKLLLSHFSIPYFNQGFLEFSLCIKY